MGSVSRPSHAASARVRSQDGTPGESMKQLSAVQAATPYPWQRQGARQPVLAQNRQCESLSSAIWRPQHRDIA
jgi:hypothetical protein